MFYDYNDRLPEVVNGKCTYRELSGLKERERMYHRMVKGNGYEGYLTIASANCEAT